MTVVTANNKLNKIITPLNSSDYIPLLSLICLM